ncbi:hypothetical protein EBR96_01700, partial [bacterium]|nr:hypothetical protein [bacterium]
DGMPTLQSKLTIPVSEKQTKTLYISSGSPEIILEPHKIILAAQVNYSENPQEGSQTPVKKAR